MRRAASAKTGAKASERSGGKRSFEKVCLRAYLCDLRVGGEGAEELAAPTLRGGCKVQRAYAKAEGQARASKYLCGGCNRLIRPPSGVRKRARRNGGRAARAQSEESEESEERGSRSGAGSHGTGRAGACAAHRCFAGALGLVRFPLARVRRNSGGGLCFPACWERLFTFLKGCLHSYNSYNWYKSSKY